MQFKKVAITGGAGYLGQYVTAELAGRCDVTVLDIKEPEADVAFARADVRDLESIRRGLAGHDAVIHLGGLDLAVDVAPEAFIETNTLGTWHVLQAAYEAGITKVVQCSSVAVTGVGESEREKPHYIPVDEAHPLEASHPYGVSKRAAELMARSFVRRGGISVICLRPLLVMYPFYVPKAVARMAEDEGRRLFYYVSPEDTARAFRLALEVEGVAFDTILVGAADTCTEEPTLDFMHRLYGEMLHVRRPELYERNPRASVIDISRAHKVLGYEPTSSWPELLKAHGGGG